MDVHEAAVRLGLSLEGVRKRLQRGQFAGGEELAEEVNGFVARWAGDQVVLPVELGLVSRAHSGSATTEASS